MQVKEKTVEVQNTTEPETEEYALNYIVNFNNCVFNEKVMVNQTGKPTEDDPPGTGG